MAQGDILVAQKFTDLKARVKAEVGRRSGYGNISGLASSSYDYSTAMAVGTIIKEEHVDKIRDVMAQINTVAMSEKSVGSLLEDMDVLDTKLTAFQAQTKKASTNDCSSYCTGMCVATCTGDCSGGCSGCSGCGSGCADGCDGDCDGCSGCGSGCASGCEGGCKGCDGCGGACSNSCSGGCNGCVGSCEGGCWRGCDGDCGGGCSMCSSCTGCRTSVG